MKIIDNILLYLWQLPQNLLGLCCLLYFRKERKVAEREGRRFYITPAMKGAISLGQYILLSPGCASVEEVYYHEYGHTIQSHYLGWFYLPVVGLTSLIHTSLCRADDYYHFWTERWANRLGGIPNYNGEGRVHTDRGIRIAW